jgi:hypothetical protein
MKQVSQHCSQNSLFLLIAYPLNETHSTFSFTRDDIDILICIPEMIFIQKRNILQELLSKVFKMSTTCYFE